MEARLQILMHRPEDGTESTVVGRRQSRVWPSAVNTQLHHIRCNGRLILLSCFVSNLSKCSKRHDRLNAPLTNDTRLHEAFLTKTPYNEPQVPSRQYIILSEFANITPFTSTHCKWEFMRPLLYHSSLFFVFPSPPSSGSHAVRDRYSHQRQYPS